MYRRFTFLGLVIAVLLMVYYSPFGDQVVRRGLIVGAITFLCFLGLYRQAGKS